MTSETPGSFAQSLVKAAAANPSELTLVLDLPGEAYERQKRFYLREFEESLQGVPAATETAQSNGSPA